MVVGRANTGQKLLDETSKHKVVMLALMLWDTLEAAVLQDSSAFG